jgi:hypothetical protein
MRRRKTTEISFINLPGSRLAQRPNSARDTSVLLASSPSAWLPKEWPT